MKIFEVINGELDNAFIQFPVALYKNDVNYIRPLDDDLRKIFDPKRNKYFKHGRLIRYLLADESGNWIGRIAAMINERNYKDFPQPTGFFGFFECINNQEAANLLFDKAKEWIQAQGMEAMNGPVNFGERNNWWGLLVDGYLPPSYGMNYNPPYYKSLFENYGLQVYYYQYSYSVKVQAERPKKYFEKSELLLKDKNYRFEHLQLHQMDKFAKDFMTVFNKAFGGREGVKDLTLEQVNNLLKSMKPVIVDYLMWFGYYKEEPIAIFFALPELNNYFKYVNGKMDLLGKLKFLYHKWKGDNHKIFGFLFGVVPEHQGKGVEGGIIIAADKIFNIKKQWTEGELTWIADFNPKMMSVAENLGAKIVKTHATFRYIFDQNIPFERHPIEV